MDKSVPEVRVDTKVVMSAEALELFTHTDFMNIVMSCEY